MLDASNKRPVFPVQSNHYSPNYKGLIKILNHIGLQISLAMLANARQSISRCMPKAFRIAMNVVSWVLVYSLQKFLFISLLHRRNIYASQGLGRSHHYELLRRKFNLNATANCTSQVSSTLSNMGHKRIFLFVVELLKKRSMTFAWATQWKYMSRHCYKLHLLAKHRFLKISLINLFCLSCRQAGRQASFSPGFHFVYSLCQFL